MVCYNPANARCLRLRDTSERTVTPYAYRTDEQSAANDDESVTKMCDINLLSEWPVALRSCQRPESM